MPYWDTDDDDDDGGLPDDVFTELELAAGVQHILRTGNPNATSSYSAKREPAGRSVHRLGSSWGKLTYDFPAPERVAHDALPESERVPYPNDNPAATSWVRGAIRRTTLRDSCPRSILRIRERYHLKHAGAVTINTAQDGVQMELGLSTLVRMPQMEALFGKDLTFEVQAVFCDQDGANLRNDVAHGLISDDAGYSADSVYAWWFVFRMVFFRPRMPVRRRNGRNRPRRNLAGLYSRSEL